jgi:hypothetical protein
VRAFALALALMAGCVAAERVELPPELDAHQSMIFATVSPTRSAAARPRLFGAPTSA